MNDFIGQCFQVDLADDYGCVGFKGTIKAVHVPFIVFHTDNEDMIVNERYIKTMIPRKIDL